LRETRGTSPGARLLNPRGSQTAAARRLGRSLQAVNRPSGLLRIAAPVLFGSTFVVPALAEFAVRYPPAASSATNPAIP
jgi:DNA-binding transcriptional LysR family regulator